MTDEETHAIEDNTTSALEYLEQRIYSLTEQVRTLQKERDRAVEQATALMASHANDDARNALQVELERCRRDRDEARAALDASRALARGYYPARDRRRAKRVWNAAMESAARATRESRTERTWASEEFCYDAEHAIRALKK